MGVRISFAAHTKEKLGFSFLMEDLLIWYNKNKRWLHPVVLAANMYEKLVAIHPFIDGNGLTSKLLMNLILLQHGFVIANIKGDNHSRNQYFTALEAAQIDGNNSAFVSFVIDMEKQAFKNILIVLKFKYRHFL